jgi:hypothetical protein
MARWLAIFSSEKVTCEERIARAALPLIKIMIGALDPPTAPLWLRRDLSGRG